jgi:hypothetical protein
MYTSLTVIPDPPIQLLATFAIDLDDIRSVEFIVDGAPEDGAIINWKNPHAPTTILPAEDARRLYASLGGEIGGDDDDEPEVPPANFLEQVTQGNGYASGMLRSTLADFVEWLKTERPPALHGQNIVDAYLNHLIDGLVESRA